ncbi:DUF58 domain-containing protein [Salana multivorans]
MTDDAAARLRAPERTPAWFGIRSATAVAVVALGLLLAGVALGRPALVAVVAPLLVVPITARRRPAEPVPGPPQLRIERDPVPGTHTTVLVPPSGETRVRVSLPGYPEVFALLAADPVAVTFESARTGVLPPLRVDSVPVTADGERESAPVTTFAPGLVVEPARRPVSSLPTPHHLVGSTGIHRSRRRGQGEDLLDIALFAPGDRLRSVDWRVTARRGTTNPLVGTQMWVRRHHADAEAVVVVVLDSRDDVGIDVRTWAGGQGSALTQPTSLDVARQAAASYAQVYIEQGDRVAFADLGHRTRPLRPGAGRRHLERIVQAITRSSAVGEPGRLVRAPQVTTGALVVVVSTFLDEAAAAAATSWVRAGHPVLAVDVLPPTHLGSLSGAERVAARLVLAERRQRLRDLAATGISVEQWWRA